VDVGDRLRDPRAVEYGELPEVTRALRALGSARRSSGAFQTQFFLPLLEARKRAATTRSAVTCLRAFDVSELDRALDRAVERILLQWPDERVAARRALRAELLDRVSGYRSALDALSQRAAGVINADEASKLAAWRDWTAQLAVVFEAADASWMALRSVIDSLPRKHQGKGPTTED
jgi:hypothetical protein